MKTLKQKIQKLFFIVSCLGVVPVFAQTVRPLGNGTWYYSIGGGDPMMYYHQSNKTNMSLEVGAEWNMFRKCSFDPSASIEDTFKNIEENLYGMANDVLDSAILVFGAWGLSKIQENHPGLYDTISKGLYDAKESYTLSVKNCRDVQRDIRTGANPVDGWYSWTRKSSWDKAAKEGQNPVKAAREIEEDAGESGVVWIDGGKAGGRNSNGTLQPPIRAVEDIVRAGYDHLVGDEVIDLDDADGIPEVTGDPNIARIFDEPEDAAEWTTAVVGEREIRTCSGCDPLKTRVGQGLRYQYREERKVVDVVVQALVSAMDGEIDQEALNALSVPSMGITINEHIVRSLREAPVHERYILMNRLAGEVALARVMEKALVARDLMNTGSQEPNVSALGDVPKKEIERTREILETEIDNVLFETRVRDEVLTNAAGFISLRGANRRSSPDALDYLNPKREERELKEGGLADD